MKTFIVACIAAAVIAIGAVVVLNSIQKPVETAFSTTGVRIIDSLICACPYRKTGSHFRDMRYPTSAA